MANNKPDDLWDRVTSHDGLQNAWSRVNANEGSAGGDGVNRRDFGRDLFAQLTELRAELLAGSYRTGPFRRVSIPKKKPGYRILTIPSIRDRVLHTSIAQVLTPILEPMFEDGSFGYRPGRGVQRAVERIEMWRNRGYDVVIEADIVKYFDNIDHEILLEKLDSTIGNLPGAAPLIRLIRQLITEQGAALKTPGRGVAQGSPLSPLLANLYLDALDEEIEDQGVKIVRFADDFVILCKSLKKAEKVLDHCISILADHNLRLHADGTRIVSFDKGFDFVGYLFLRSLSLKKGTDPTSPPPAKPVKSEVTDEGIIILDSEGSRWDPGKRVLYVLDPQHCLAIRNRSFSVTRDDGSELIAIPHRRVGRIEIGPDVSWGQPAVDLALDTRIELAFVDGLGQSRGFATPPQPKRAGLHLSQARAVLDDTFRLEISRALANARIRNQRTQLSRLGRGKDIPGLPEALRAMKLNLRKLPHQTSVKQIFGVEGATSALYWPALGSLLDGEEDATFARSRPARDPVNAAINYFTGILERDIRAAIQGAGLHPGFAFLHGSRDRHDGLVFDLMEPFRAPLTEGSAIYLFNSARLRDDMFDTDTQGDIRISQEGRGAIVKGYESAIARPVNKTDGPGKLAWRPMMLHMARGLADAVKKGDPDRFKPYLMEA